MNETSKQGCPRQGYTVGRIQWEGLATYELMTQPVSTMEGSPWSLAAMKRINKSVLMNAFTSPKPFQHLCEQSYSISSPEEKKVSI